MTILEFDKFKKLLSPWPIAYYGLTEELQLELDLPSCACYQSVNNITLNFYKKGETGTEENLLITSQDFTLLDQTTWSGKVVFTGNKLFEYIKSVADGTAVLDGEFVFQVSGNKTIKSQIFYVKIYGCEPPQPPTPTYPTTEEMDKAIQDAIEKHNTDPNVHSDLLIPKVNNIDELTKESKPDFYVYDLANSQWIFDTTLNGNIIYINSVAPDINTIILNFTNNKEGSEVQVYFNKQNYSVSFVSADSSIVEVISSAETGYFRIDFGTIKVDSDVKVMFLQKHQGRV